MCICETVPRVNVLNGPVEDRRLPFLLNVFETEAQDLHDSSYIGLLD